MKLTQDGLDRLQVSAGFVLLKVEEIKKERTNGGIFITAISDITTSDVLAKKGTVVRLNKDTDIPYNNFTYHTECEVEIGDEVFFSSFAIAEVFKYEDRNRIFNVGEDVYLLIPYKFLVLRKRGNEFLGLNDNVILKTLPVKVESSLYIPERSAMNKPRGDKMEVVYVPSFNCEYKQIEGGGRPLRSQIVEAGDVVKLYRNGGTISRLESDLRNELGQLYYTRSSDIMGVYKTEET